MSVNKSPSDDRLFSVLLFVAFVTLFATLATLVVTVFVYSKPISTVAASVEVVSTETPVPAIAAANTEALPTSTPIPLPATLFMLPTMAPPLATDTPALLSPTTQPWYSGGTLHSATVAEWRAADQRNKLATSADWAANGFDLYTWAEIETYALELLDCVEEASSAYPESHSVTDLAAACIVIMKNP